MKEGKTALGVLLFAIVAGVVGILLPGPEMATGVYPWQVEVTEGGNSRVFGLEVGADNILTAEKLLQYESEISLFATDAGEYTAEGYFDRVELGGLSAKLVVTADLSHEQLEEAFKRGLRIATLGSGTRKVTLAPEDVAVVRAAPIASLTYLPSLQIAAETVQGRFGQPAQRIVEGKGTDAVEHWLYPAIGLDVAVSERKKEVFQYVPPRRFEALMQPLHEKGTVQP